MYSEKIVCRCSKFDNNKEKHERELEDKRKDYISKKRLLQSTDHCKWRRDYSIKENIKTENSN